MQEAEAEWEGGKLHAKSDAHFIIYKEKPLLKKEKK